MKNLTPKQEAFVNGWVENSFKVGEKKTMGEIALDAGYARGQAVNPNRILKCKAVKEKLSTYVKEVERVRNTAIKQMTKDKLIKSDPAKLAYITDIMTKQHQLLSGEPTERTEIDSAVDKINALFISIKENAKPRADIIQQETP
jgi:hypothetical protein